MNDQRKEGFAIKEQRRILVVTGSLEVGGVVKDSLAKKGYLLSTARDRLEALAMMGQRQSVFEMVLLDADFPQLGCVDLVKEIKKRNSHTITILMAAESTLRSLAVTPRNGVDYFLKMPVREDELISLVEDAFQTFLFIENGQAGLSDKDRQTVPASMKSLRHIVGKSAPMQKIYDLIAKLSKVDTAVFIRGESGTGKELVAKAIHFNSLRREGRFVPVNLSAVPENLIESELFGHEKGSYTGADARKIGKLQYADGGTLFLDEIGDVSLNTQVKLLRVLQEKRFTPIGSNQEIEVSVRIIAASNRDIEDLIQKGRFRKDLYYRLHVLPISIAPLRDRKEDVDLLVQHFIRKFNVIHRKSIRGIVDESLDVLKRYNWPGNIRELENVIEHAFIIEATDWITPGSLPDVIVAPMKSVSVEEVFPIFQYPVMDYRLVKARFEKDFITNALKTFNGRINKTALGANIPKKTLLRKIEKYNIDTDVFRI